MSNVQRNVVLKLATVTKVVMNNQGWTRTRGLTAIAVDEVNQYTLARFESLEALGAWLEANGFQWIANSRGRYQSLLPIAA